MNQVSKSPLGGPRVTARAFLVSDRLNTSGLERGDVLSTTPLAFRVNDGGIAILFRYGVVVLIGLNAVEEDEFLRGLQSLAGLTDLADCLKLTRVLEQLVAMQARSQVEGEYLLDVRRPGPFAAAVRLVLRSHGASVALHVKSDKMPEPRKETFTA